MMTTEPQPIEGWHVFCTDIGVYHLATRQMFDTQAEAQTYASTCAASRNPVVITRHEIIRSILDARKGAS